MTIYKEWFVILSLVGLLSSKLLGKDLFNYSLTPPTIQPGNHALLRISVPLDKEETESSLTINDAPLFNNSSIHIIEKSSERTECCLEIKYEITGYKTEILTIPPLELKTPSNSFSTETQQLSITSERGPDDNELRESFTSIRAPLPWIKWLKRSVFLFLLVLITRFLLRKLKSLKLKKKPRLLIAVAPPKEDPMLWLGRQIAALKKKLKEDPSNQLLVDEWSQIIRGFLEKSSFGPALCWTTREIKLGLKEQTQLHKLVPCLEKSDHYKFQPDYKQSASTASLVTHFIQETENYLSLCGN